MLQGSQEDAQVPKGSKVRLSLRRRGGRNPPRVSVALLGELGELDKPESSYNTLLHRGGGCRLEVILLARD